VATSGSYDYLLTAANVIDVAVENLGVLAAGGTIASADQTLALRRLNMIAKQYQGTNDGAPGLKVHTRQRLSLLLAKGQQTYSIGPASTDARSSTAVGRTTISADEAAAQTVISITSNTDTTSYPGTTITMTSADFVGIELNDGTIHWTTISGTPSTTMTIVAQLPSASSAGRYVWWFTARAQRVVHVESAILRDKNFNDTPLTIYRQAEQYDQGVASKLADGDPTSILVEPLRIATRITLDSQPTDVTKQIVITGWYPQEDYDATANDIAFPQEAFRFLAWELTFEMAPAFGVTWTPEMDKNRFEARQSFQNLNPENSVLYFQGSGV
jgi:hypothetical protein